MALFKASEIKKYVAVNATFTGANLEPAFLEVEEELLPKYLGRELYEALLAATDAPETIPLKFQALVPKVYRILFPLALATYSDEGQLNIGNAGFRIQVDDSNKTAFEWQIKGFKEGMRLKAMKALDSLLLYLEDKIQLYPEWAASEACTVFDSYYINSSREFSAEYDIGNSVLRFLELLPVMRQIEAFRIDVVLSPALARAVKDEIKAGDPSDPAIEVLERIRPALAYLTMAKALDGAKGPEQEQNRELLRQSGEEYLEQLEEFLNLEASEEKFKPYFESDRYTAPNASRTLQNPTNSPIYRAF